VTVSARGSARVYPTLQWASRSGNERRTAPRTPGIAAELGASGSKRVAVIDSVMKPRFIGRAWAVWVEVLPQPTFGSPEQGPLLYGWGAQTHTGSHASSKQATFGSRGREGERPREGGREGEGFAAREEEDRAFWREKARRKSEGAH
jgi:hypothetical protein